MVYICVYRLTTGFKNVYNVALGCDCCCRRHQNGFCASRSVWCDSSWYGHRRQHQSPELMKEATMPLNRLCASRSAWGVTAAGVGTADAGMPSATASAAICSYACSHCCSTASGTPGPLRRWLLLGAYMQMKAYLSAISAASAWPASDGDADGALPSSC